MAPNKRKSTKSTPRRLRSSRNTRTPARFRPTPPPQDHPQAAAEGPSMREELRQSMREMAEDMRSSIKDIVREEIQAVSNSAPTSPAPPSRPRVATAMPTEESDSDDGSDPVQAHSLVADAINALTNRGECGVLPSNGEPVFQYNAAALGSTIPSKLRQRIVDNQFVDLQLLLPGRDQDFSVSVQSRPGMGNTVSLSPSRGNGFRSVDEWQEAYLIFAAIYMAQHPEEGPGLLKHLSLVRRLAKLGHRWQFYDTQFRKLRATHSFSYATYHHELYDQAKESTNFRPQLFRANRFKKPTPYTRNTYPEGYCWVFCKGDKCNNNKCQFLHKCALCQGRHPASQCQKNKRSIPDKAK